MEKYESTTPAQGFRFKKFRKRWEPYFSTRHSVSLNIQEYKDVFEDFSDLISIHSDLDEKKYLKLIGRMNT